MLKLPDSLVRRFSELPQSLTLPSRDSLPEPVKATFQKVSEALARVTAPREDTPFRGPERTEPGALDAFPTKVQGMFPSEDGTAIYYEVRGEGKPLVLCYGLTCRREHWRHQVAGFVEKYQVITFDYRGHHRSAMPRNERNLTLDWCARDVRALLDHLKLRDAILFGHSMGVPVVARAAVEMPERVKGTVLICGAVSDPFEHMFFSDRLSYVYRASAWLFEHAPGPFGVVWKGLTAHNPLSLFLTSRFGFNPTVSEERDILMYLEGVHATPLTTFHTLLDDYVRNDGRQWLERMTCPTLLIAGADDCITPVGVQQEMAALIASSELEVVAGGSHNAHMDYPGVVNRRIETFLKKVGYV